MTVTSKILAADEKEFEAMEIKVISNEN